MKYLLYLIILFLLINIFLDQLSKYRFKKNNFPPNIIFPIKEDIELPEVEEGFEIPKIIYRCHKDKESISKYQKVFDSTSKLMPEYKQIIYDDNEIDKFIKDNFSDRIYKAYNSINPIYGPAKSDFFRYLIIYLYGGIYFDIKTGPKSSKVNNIIKNNQGKNLISIGENKYVGLIPNFHLLPDGYDNWSSFTNTLHNEYVQFYIISPKGNKIMKQMIKQVVSNIEEGLKNKHYYNKGNVSVVVMTGPIAYSLIINKYHTKKNSEFFKEELNSTISHSLVNYKSIEKNKHYRNLKDKKVLL